MDLIENEFVKCSKMLENVLICKISIKIIVRLFEDYFKILACLYMVQ